MDARPETNGCRIGKIRPRVGGASLHVLRPRADRATAEIKRAARSHLECLDQYDRIDGYVMVWWDHRGDYRCGWSLRTGSIVSETLMPSFVRDVLLRERMEKSLQQVTGQRADQGDAE